MYIVLDSNIWISELGLGTAQGAALQFFVKSQRAVIAIPEVVKREVEHNLTKKLFENCEIIEENHRELLSVLRKLEDVMLPSHDDIAAQITKLFDNLNVELIELPFTLESASSSFEKVITGLPPSGPKNQQFKDGVIWADCLKLLEDKDVAFVTKDKGFYRDRQYQNGLASNLQKEQSEKPYNLDIYDKVTDLIETLRSPVDIDESQLIKEFSKYDSESIERIIGAHGFALIGSPYVESSLFITENPDDLYIDFSIIFDCEDISGAGREGGRLMLQGDAWYHPVERTFTDFRNKGKKLTFTDSSGEQERNEHVLMADCILFGHRKKEYKVREKLV